ncbi:YidH family protein [Ancylobacter sonchi]
MAPELADARTSRRGASTKWWHAGTRPDYRFSLANERTFLAWIRTALALIAGAIGIDQFASHLATPPLRLALSLCLLAVGGLLGGLAYRRWAGAERAMRHDEDLPRSLLLPLMALVVTLIAVVLAGFVISG